MTRQHTIAAAAASLLRSMAADLCACHSFAGEWQLIDAADHAAKANHDRAITLADELEAIPAPVVRYDTYTAEGD